MASVPNFAATPYLGALSMTATTACTTRAPTATASLAAANIIELVGTSTSGRRIDSIEVTAASTSITSATTAGLIGIWAWNGTTAFLIDEIAVSAVTPSATVPAFTTTKYYANPIILPAAWKLFASTSVTTTAATNALTVIASGGDY